MRSAHHLAFFVLAALAAAGCTSTEPSPADSSTEAKIIAGDKGTPPPGPSCDGVPTPMCAAGTQLVDTNGDGCIDACEPVACPPFMPTCQPGEKVADTNGDGCALECAACPAILCQAGTKQVDSNGDGCEDACEPIACPPVIPSCNPGEKVADTDGDGCALECELIACPPFIPTCPAGQVPADTDGDGCALECK
jgi:hypothetical protein